MNPLTTTKEALEENANLAKEYGESELEYYKIKSFYLASSIGYSLSKKVLIGTFVLIFFLFSSLALAILVGEHFSSLSLGFLFVGILYLIFALMVYVFRKKIETYIVMSFSKYFD